MSVVELFGFSSVREDGVTGVTMLTRMTCCIGLYYGVLGYILALLSCTGFHSASLNFTGLHQAVVDWAMLGCTRP